MVASSRAIDIKEDRDGVRAARADRVAVEEPLEIQLVHAGPGGRAAKSISVTMRTPGHDHDLAVGFLYGESIIASRDDVAAVSHVEPVSDEGQRNSVGVELAQGVAADLERLERHFYTTSSCGVCGKTSLDALYATGRTSLADNATQFSRPVIVGIPGKLRDAQAVFESTGDLHAAAAFTPQGEIVVPREDVGRHNAVDKVVGALLMDGRLLASGLGLMVSVRASFELMQKALVAGMPLLAAKRKLGIGLGETTGHGKSGKRTPTIEQISIRTTRKKHGRRTLTIGQISIHGRDFQSAIIDVQKALS